MSRTRESFKEQCGFLTIAQNTDTTDYLNLAYLQALSIKTSQRRVTSYAVLVDEHTNALVTEKHRKVFDYVIVMPQDDSKNDNWKLRNEWQVWNLTPFRETIKLESDILFTVCIDHWWDGLRLTDVCLTSHVMNYEGNVATCRAYRKLFDDNSLPDVYNGVAYFRFTKTAAEFFGYVKLIYAEWELFKTTMLKNCRDDNPTTDVVYAIAALLTGVEQCTNPALPYPTFVHMKGGMQGWGAGTDWTDTVYSQLNDKLDLTIGFTRQTYPVHYYQKTFASTDVVKRFEDVYARVN